MSAALWRKLLAASLYAKAQLFRQRARSLSELEWCQSAGSKQAQLEWLKDPNLARVVSMQERRASTSLAALSRKSRASLASSVPAKNLRLRASTHDCMFHIVLQDFDVLLSLRLRMSVSMLPDREKVSCSVEVVRHKVRGHCPTF